MTPVPSDSTVARSEQHCGDAGGPVNLGRGDRDVEAVARAALALLRYVCCTCHLRDRSRFRDHHAVDCPLVLSIRVTALAQSAGIEPYSSPQSAHGALNRRGILCAPE